VHVRTVHSFKPRDPTLVTYRVNGFRDPPVRKKGRKIVVECPHSRVFWFSLPDTQVISSYFRQCLQCMLVITVRSLKC
jgi:hypothetical protein